METATGLARGPSHRTHEAAIARLARPLYLTG